MAKNVLKIKEISDNPSLNIALDTIEMGKQALIFVNTKRGAEKLSEEISKKIKSSSPEAQKLSEDVLGVLSSPTKQCKRLSNCVIKGIAFHHAGLHHEQKSLIEDNFRNGVIKIICCTPTLAMGIDLPAYRTILRDLKRYGGTWGMQWIPVLEYHQMAGRSGRPKFDEKGEAIAIASSPSEKEAIIETYINGLPEDIYSKLAVEPVLRTYLLSLISTEFVRTKKELFDFFGKTFWAYQYKNMERLNSIISRTLKLLEDWEFIKTKEDDFVSADNLGDDRIKATLLGKRVAQLYIDPLTAHHLIVCLKRSPSVMLRPISFLQAVSNTLEMRPLLRVKAKEVDDVQENIFKYESFFLDKEPNVYDIEYEEYLNSVKTSMMFLDWIDEKNEEYLLETYDVRPGEHRVKLEIADWLLYSMEEIARILRMQPVLKEILKVRLMLQYGAKEELLNLLRLKNIGRVRARKLYNSQIKTVEDVKKADLSRLSFLVGNSVALDIKKQVGQDIEKLPVQKGRRKGQINIEDFWE